MRLTASRLVLTALCLTGSALPAAAQAITGPADAARVQERLNQPSIREEGANLVEVEGPSITNAPAGADKISLTLSDIALDGLTTYQTSEVSPLYADKIGQKITVADVYQIAADLTRKYRNDGFILTQVVVPPQTIEGGHVRLQVVEGFISDIVVDGVDSESERKLITAYASQMKGEPLNTRKLEQATLLINDLPGVSARSIISPAANTPGGAIMRVLVERKSYDGQVSLDNYGSRYLGPLQAQLSAGANSLLGLNERISADAIFAPSPDFGKELVFGDVAYLQPFGRFGTSVEVKAGVASSDPGYTLAQFDVEGRSVTYSIKLNQPVIRSRATNWSVYSLLDSRDNTTWSNVDNTRHDHIRALRLGTEFSTLDRFLGGGYNRLNVEFAHGFDMLGASSKGDANLSRADGNPQFSKIEAEAQRLQRLGRNVNLLAGIKGQLAGGAMLSSEEFGIGGPAYGRGYDPSEIVGDDGVAAKLEVQWTNPVEVSWLKSWQVYSFLDGGYVWNDDASTEAEREMAVLSTGLGLRTTLKSNTEAGVYVALPLNRDVQTLGDDDPRVFFNLGQKF